MYYIYPNGHFSEGLHTMITLHFSGETDFINLLDIYTEFFGADGNGTLYSEFLYYSIQKNYSGVELSFYLTLMAL